MNLTGWSKSLEVTADGAGIVSHAGLAVLRLLADKTGLTGGLSHAPASIEARHGALPGVTGHAAYPDRSAAPGRGLVYRAVPGG